MVLSDRIAVMHQGKIVQIGSPGEIYQEPADPFVAGFIGLANFVPARLVGQKGDQGVVELSAGGDLRFSCRMPAVYQEGALGLLFVRPEDIDLVPEGEAGLAGTVTRRTFLGNVSDYRIEAENMEWRVETDPDVQFEEGDHVSLRIKRALFLGEKETEREPTAT
jgi:iron(III) transport system ATP-binding protein